MGFQRDHPNYHHLNIKQSIKKSPLLFYKFIQISNHFHSQVVVQARSVEAKNSISFSVNKKQVSFCRLKRLPLSATEICWNCQGIPAYSRETGNFFLLRIRIVFDLLIMNEVMIA